MVSGEQHLKLTSGFHTHVHMCSNTRVPRAGCSFSKRQTDQDSCRKKMKEKLPGELNKTLEMQTWHWLLHHHLEQRRNQEGSKPVLCDVHNENSWVKIHWCLNTEKTASCDCLQSNSEQCLSAVWESCSGASKPTLRSCPLWSIKSKSRTKVSSSRQKLLKQRKKEWQLHKSTSQRHVWLSCKQMGEKYFQDQNENKHQLEFW